MILLLVLACAEAGDSGIKLDTGNPDDTGLTSVSDDFCGVKQIFDAECVVCHSASAASGGLDLETDPYNAIVGVTSSAYAGQTLVVAGDSGGSFLYQKMVDGQAGDGDVMPPAGALSSSVTDVVKSWIDSGASPDCSTVDTDTSTSKYHPEGWDAPTEHGMGAKFQEDDCLSCHGSDLKGGSSGVSCDTCHDAGWETNCTFCHGGDDNNTGAPGEDIDDQSSDLSFPEHSAHVENTDLHDAFDCVQCHTKPTEALSNGHFLVADSTPGVAEMKFSGGLSDKATFSGGGCSNLYCHGDGTGDNGAIDIGDSVNNCDSCHTERGLNGKHDDHLEEGVDCEDCHSDTVSSSTHISDPSKHVNGTVDVHLPSGMSWDGSRCDGECHGERHNDRSW